MSEQTITFPASENKIAMPAEAVSLSEAEKIKKGICPDCNEQLTFEEGCKHCVCCGWGACE